MDLKATQLKDTFGNLLTIGTSAGTPTTGILQNGDGGNVTALGIGISSPTNALAVSGSIGLSGSVLFDDNQGVKYGNANAQITGSTANGLMFFAGGTEKMRFDTSGNLGVGETNPSAKLHVKNDSGDTLTLTKSTTEPSLRFEGDTDKDFVLTISGETFSITKNDGVTDILTLDHDTSRVGLKENAPDANLEIANNDGSSYRFGYLSTSDVYLDSDNIYLRSKNGGSNYGIFQSGKLGIGTVSPDAPLTVHSSTDPEIRFGYSAAQDHRIAFDSSKVFLDADPDAANASSGVGLRVDATLGLFVNDSRNVAIGVNDPIEVSTDARWLTIDSNSDATISGGIVHAINGSSKAVQYVYQSNVLYDAKSGIGHQFTVNNGSEVMRMDTASRMLVGKTSSGLGVEGVEFNTTSHFTNFTRERNSAGGTIAQFNRTGSADGSAITFYRSGSEVGSISVTSSATAFNTSSDYRLKENIKPLSSALETISKIKPSTFNFIDAPNETVDGFIAHELAEVLSYAVSGEKDGKDEHGNPIYQGVDHSKLVPLLVGAIQELKAEIEQLKNK